MDRLVFIIDDDLLQNEIHSILLRKIDECSEVCSFTSSKEAIEAIDNGQIPDIVFLDLHIPGEEERSFLKAHKLRSLSSDIFLMSSLIYLDDTSLISEFSSVKDFISKPLLAHKLKYVLSQCA